MTNYYNVIRKNLETHHDTALSFGLDAAGQVSYRELHQRVIHFRNIIRIAKLRSPAAIIMGIPLSANTIAACIAILAEGHTAAFLPNKNLLHALRSIGRSGFNKAIILDRRPGLLKLIFYKVFGIKVLIADEKERPFDHKKEENTSSNSIALLSFSSGSTGKPKPVLRSHEVLINQHKAISDVYPLVEDQTDLPLFPNLILHNLAIGAHSVLPDKIEISLQAIQPKCIIEQIDTFKVNTLTGNVFYFEKLINYCKLHNIYLHQVKEIGIGGSPVPEHLLTELQDLFPSANIHIVYGSTEAEPIAHRTYRHSSDPLDGYYVGEIHPSVEFSFVNSETIQLVKGKQVESGEICVKGPHVITGKNGWLNTGDFGYIRNDKLYLTAREGNQKAWGGFQHYQLEHFLWADKNIHKVAALSGNKGFSIHYDGTATETYIRDVLSTFIQSKWIISIYKNNFISYDDRHLSKILYHKLKQ